MTMRCEAMGSRGAGTRQVDDGGYDWVNLALGDAAICCGTRGEEAICC